MSLIYLYISQDIGHDIGQDICDDISQKRFIFYLLEASKNLCLINLIWRPCFEDSIALGKILKRRTW